MSRALRDLAEKLQWLQPAFRLEALVLGVARRGQPRSVLALAGVNLAAVGLVVLGLDLVWSGLLIVISCSLAVTAALRPQTEAPAVPLAVIADSPKPEASLAGDSSGASADRAERRRSARELVEAAVAEGRGVAVIAFDIDRMKEVNGCYGYAVGDAILAAADQRLSGLAPGRVFRVSGDRFVMVAAADGREMAEATAAEALRRLCQPVAVDCADSDDPTAAASIGIALLPAHGRDFEALMRAAEMAMAEAKRLGGRRYRVFDDAMILGLKVKKDIERDLRQALRNGDLSLHYQPQLALADGCIIAVEALLRWQHRQRGMISPATFIPIAEATGLIRSIGTWVIYEACRQTRAWHDEGLPVRVAVNISAAQLKQQDLPAIVADALAETGLDAASLEIELTESLFVDPSELMMRRSLQKLTEMGVRLAIDDFGTGYSSLAYLKRLPVEKIKIDRAFTNGIGREEVDEALVRAIIGLARTFGKQVVAEGVETEAQRAFLAAEGCDEAQGYLFAKPLPAEAATGLLRQWAVGEAPPPPERAAV